MERYIGVLKDMVSLRSNIDKDLANKVTTFEHLNHLPTRDRHLPPIPTFPFAPTDSLCRSRYKKPIPRQWEDKLSGTFGDFRGQYPDIAPIGEEVKLWKKYHVMPRCLIGSIESLVKTSNRRDDSFCWWTDADNHRQYGQVTIFAEVYNWEAVALVRSYKKVLEDEILGTTVVEEDLGGLKLILVSEIEGLIGRITKVVEGKKRIYLVRN